MKTRYIKVIFILSGLLLQNSLMAQQIPENNFKIQNPYIFNPAATGLFNNVTAFIDYRDSWTGFKDAPEYSVFGIHGLITKSMGLGLKAANLKSGIFRRLSLDFDYSYRIAFSRDHNLAMGISAGILQNKISMGDVIMNNLNDPALTSNNFDEAMFNVGFGVNYVWKELTVNLSSPLLYSTQENKFLQTAFVMASYDFYFTDDIWRLQPSLLYEYTDKGIHQGEIDVVLDWNRHVWVQAGYNTNESIIAGLGVILKKLSIGYSYQVSLSEIAMVSSGSQNIMLQYQLPYSVTKKAPLYRRTRRRDAW
jgi:type IX secretion system PorP/SprF family membrane protein